MANDLLHSTEDFRVLVEKERTRSDRTGRSFSLVLLDPGIAAKAGTGAGPGTRTGRRSGNDLCLWKKSFSLQLVRRMRTTDEAGWIDERRLGVLLPETQEEGARRFAANLASATSSVAPSLRWEILTYPSPTVENGNEEGEDGGKTVHPARESGESPDPCAAGIMSIAAPPLPPWKRVVDVILSCLLLLVLSPLFFMVGLFIKTVSRGPVFYRHERIGRLGRPFTMWKFRTMLVNCDNSVHQNYLKTLIHAGRKSMQKLDEGQDQRLLPFGRVLRKTCIDELPQLINVLLGDMSLVGPRPCLRYEANEFLPWHHQRFDSLPGMTGLWQVSGKNRTTFRQMMEFDIRYGRRHSLRQDLAILLMTPQAVLAQIADTLRNRRERKIRPRLAGQLARTSFFLSLLLAGIISLSLISFVR
jgi:lipopolysaccharide/colanic/teichoic acid biosynthesis glycosyltransferase